MSFVKRNTVLSSPRAGLTLSSTPQQQQPKQEKQLAPGLRPSPTDGRLTTSTGTASLDQLLAGHGGLPLGTCLLVEEQGTTDFSGILLRYYAAEGLVQGHQVHAVAFPPEWRHQLPGLASPDKKSKSASPAPAPEEKMKIAWRYESLGNNANAGASTRGDSGAPFCHSFDLSKRLASSESKGTLNPIPVGGAPSLDRRSVGTASPLRTILKQLKAKLESSGPNAIHRLVVPSLLSPTLYPPGCAQPSEVLQFLHGLRALLRQYSTQLTAIITFPTSLFPRSSGLVRWIEILCDGVVELIPLPARLGAAPPPPSGSDPKANEQPQGMFKVYTLPVYHEKGGGGAESGNFRENLSFSLSASRGVVIKPYSLPPMLEDEQEKPSAAPKKDGLDF